MMENIEYSKEWIFAQILKTKIEENKTNKKVMVKVEYSKLLNLFLDFIKLNERLGK